MANYSDPNYEYHVWIKPEELAEPITARVDKDGSIRLTCYPDGTVKFDGIYDKKSRYKLVEVPDVANWETV